MIIANWEGSIGLKDSSVRGLMPHETREGDQFRVGGGGGGRAGADAELDLLAV